jgi:AbrB family looped-hinge helix DNA binding protein
MKVTMDRAGRIVLPKPVRDQLHLDTGAEFELVVDGWSLRLEPAAPPIRQVVEVDGWPVLEPVDGTTITDADVRRLRDADQR